MAQPDKDQKPMVIKLVNGRAELVGRIRPLGGSFLATQEPEHKLSRGSNPPKPKDEKETLSVAHSEFFPT